MKRTLAEWWNEEEGQHYADVEPGEERADAALRQYAHAVFHMGAAAAITTLEQCIEEGLSISEIIRIFQGWRREIESIERPKSLPSVN